MLTTQPNNSSEAADVNVTNVQALQSWYELVNKFISAQDLYKKSTVTYQDALKQFVKFIDTSGIQRINTEDIITYKRLLQSQGRKKNTINSYLIAIKKFFAWLDSRNIYPNVAVSIKLLKKPKGFCKDVLSVEQIKNLLASINTSTLKGRRDYALINLLVRTGLRTIEVIRADVGDLEQAGFEATLRVWGKGRETKDEKAILTYEVLRPLQDYLYARQVNGDNEPLFTSIANRNGGERLTTRSISRIVKERLKAVGIDNERITAHSLRHTAVTLALLGGAGLQDTQAMARHGNINTTLIYSHNIKRYENAAERNIEQMLV